MRFVPLSEMPRYTQSSSKALRVYLAIFVPTLALTALLFPWVWCGLPVFIGLVAYYLWVCHELDDKRGR